MKKFSLIFALAFCSVAIFGTNNSYAVSGTCSHHIGANCTAGPDKDGSVICLDGWKNSTVSYIKHCGAHYIVPAKITVPTCKAGLKYDTKTKKCVKKK